MDLYLRLNTIYLYFYNARKVEGRRQTNFVVGSVEYNGYFIKKGLSQSVS